MSLKLCSCRLPASNSGALEEGARIDLPLGTDTARRGRRSTCVQPGQLVTEGVQVEERVGRQYVGMLHEAML